MTNKINTKDGQGCYIYGITQNPNVPIVEDHNSFRGKHMIDIYRFRDEFPDDLSAEKIDDLYRGVGYE